MELYAVFSSPQTYTVQTAGGQPLGSLNQDFVDRLVDGVSTFLLGGRAWAVLRVQHDDRRVVVEPAPRGRQPTWGGFLPQFLGYELCQKILTILRSDESYPYLDEHAARALAAHRESMAEILYPGKDGVEFDEGEVRWWTFAGGRINSTLRYALEALGPDWKVTPDNVLIRIRGEDIDAKLFAETRFRLSNPEVWEDNRLWSEVAASLPDYRLSKFQPLMPDWVVRETLSRHLLDIRGTQAWIAKNALRS